MSLLDPILDSIAHAPEDRPARPHGTHAQQRWFRLMLDLLLDPTRWHKLGFAVQWAKWLEWEGSFEQKSSPTTSTHTPGITFLLNPLQPLRLNRLLNRLDFALVSVATLIGCYETGDWTVLLKEDGQEVATDPQHQQRPSVEEQEVLQTLEHLSLLTFYLRHARAVLLPEQPVDAEAAEEDQQIQQLVDSILSVKDPAGNSSSSTPDRAPWRDAFALKALRLSPQQDPLQPTQPSKATIFINELLELIRLDKIARDGWMAPNAVDKLTDEQFQQLGKLLSTSFFTAMEFSQSSLYIAVENLSVLSKFAAQLPASWYSDEFLRTTIHMAQQFLTKEGRDKIRVPLQVQGLASIVTLWSFWMRKTGPDTTNVLGQEMIEVMSQIMAVPSLFQGSESRGLFVGCFSGLATGLDKWGGLMQPQIVNGMVHGLEWTRLVVEASEMDAIQASLATVLKANEATRGTIRRLTAAFVKAFYGAAFHATIPSWAGRKPSLCTKDIEEEAEELFQIQRLFQYVVTTRAGLSVVREKDEEQDPSKKKRRKKQKPRKPVQLVDQEWWTDLVEGLQDSDADNTANIPLLLATAGVLRAIQHVEDDPPRVDTESLGLIEDMFVGQLGRVLDQVKQERESCRFLSDSGLRSLAFACSQTIPNLTPCKIEVLDRATLCRAMVSLIFSLSDGVVPVDALLRTVDAELSARHQLTCSPEGPAITLMTKITKHSSLFKEMGRLARTLATLVEAIQDPQEWREWGMDLVQSTHAFAINVHVVWAQSSLSRLPLLVQDVGNGAATSHLTPEQQNEVKLATGLMFQIFKTILFATVMIQGAVAETSGKSNSHIDAQLLEELDGLMLDTFGYLYFITYAMGPGSFVVYEELMTTLLTRRITIEPALLLTRTPEQQAQIDAGVPTERIYYGRLNQLLREMVPRGDLTTTPGGNPVRETRVLYFMNVVERVMMAVEEDMLLHDILPLVYPYLIRNEQKDLFESAHSVILSVLLTKRGEQSISRELAPYYGKLLLSHYPREINIDQLRAGYTTLVKALSEIDDGLAWLTVERLLERIHEYDDVVVLLADQSPSTKAQQQVVKEHEEALAEVATEVHQDLGPTANPSHLPSLHTTGTSPIRSHQHLSTGARHLERVKERGELILVLLDQLTSLNLIFVESLGQQIKALLAQEPSVQGRRALLKCVLDVVGSQGVDQTKREWAIKWYLGLVQSLGQETKEEKKEMKDKAVKAIKAPEQAVEASK